MMYNSINDKISVITVVLNDVNNIKETMDSFFSQTWENKEYIVIDGGSTDGTVDIINSYADKLAYWCSEKDDGLYEAMNKGISHVTGDWVNVLNSGDSYAAINSLEKALTLVDDLPNADVVYGDSVERDGSSTRFIKAGDDIRRLEFAPIFRHGSSLVRTEVQRKFIYDISKRDKLDYALDWEMTHRLFKAGYNFKRSNCAIEIYDKKGISNKPIRNLLYNYKITSDGKFNMRKLVFFMRCVVAIMLKNTYIYLFLRAMLLEFIPNDVLPTIPFWVLRKAYFKRLGMKIGKGSFIMKKNYFTNLNNIKLGEYSHINRGCVIIARRKVKIGNSVSISHNVNIITSGHDIKSPSFIGVYKPITISDYVWIGIGCTILQGVTIGEGAVVCAGAVVTKDVEPYDIVAGVPAKLIGKRTDKLDYKCVWETPLT